jgi:hypothetical protein
MQAIKNPLNEYTSAIAVLDQKTVVNPRNKATKTAWIRPIENILRIRNTTPKQRDPHRTLKRLTLKAGSPKGRKVKM